MDSVAALYTDRYPQRNVKHFHEAYAENHGGRRSCSWVKNCLRQAGAVKPHKRRGKHRQLRERKSRAGAMIHQDGNQVAWVEWPVI